MPLYSFLIITAIGIALWQWILLPSPRARFFVALGIIIIAAFALEVYGGITSVLIINNNLFYNLFGLAEGLLVLWLVGTLRPNWKWPLIAGGVLLAMAFAANVHIRGIHTLLLEMVLLNAFVCCLFLMSTLWWLAQNSTVPLQKLPEFWILLGLLLYFAGIVPTIGAYEFIYRDRALGEKLFLIVQGMCIIRYLLTAYGCNLARKKAGWMIPLA